MINYTIKFFNLDILRIEEIKLHETTESNRLRNIFDRIAGSKHLMNPVIVGRTGKNLILIDGANRLSTLSELGCKLIIAQIIDYKNPKIKIKNWNHLVYGISLNDIISVAQTNGLNYFNCKRSEVKKLNKNIQHSIIASDTKDNNAVLITLSNSFNKFVKELHYFTKFYFGTFDFDRSEQEIPFRDLKNYSRKNGILIEFPKFTKNDIIRISQNKFKLPAGISRHILDNRVLHVRYDINKLKDDKNIENKRKELNRFLLGKIDNNKVRQYKESVIVFDE